MTWTEHKEKWRDCEGCELAFNRDRVVLARGRLPCNVLFVGEGPGESEDLEGQPFVGPAGQLLDQIIALALDQAGLGGEVSVGFVNLVACLPDRNEKGKVGPPHRESIKACAPRLEELARIARPDALVAVGRLSEKWLPVVLPDLCMRLDHVVALYHPASILRANPAQKTVLIQTCVVTLADLFMNVGIPF